MMLDSVPDERLRSDLAVTDLSDQLARNKNCLLLRYDARSRKLVLQQNLAPRIAPKPDQFDAAWELMIRAANLNHSLNSPSRL